ncbi:MAG: class I SAM-dependent methyltransferase [Promethearchaeota archaeon]
MILERLDPDIATSYSIRERFTKILRLIKNLVYNVFALFLSRNNENIFIKNLKARYNFCNNYIDSKIVLDIPCGVGWGTSLLKGYGKLYGIDIDKQAIEKAKKKYPQIIFKKGSMQNIPFENEFFDVIICLEGIEHITFIEGQDFLIEVNRTLKKDGIFIITTPLLLEGKYHSGNKFHLCEYKEEEFLRIIKEKYFSILKKDYINNPRLKILRLVLKKDSN